jgi:uncharacterized membrane protein
MRILGILVYVILGVSTAASYLVMAVMHPDTMLGFSIPTLARWLDAQAPWPWAVLLAGIFGPIAVIVIAANITSVKDAKENYERNCYR